jgi:hypothetical protein
MATPTPTIPTTPVTRIASTSDNQVTGSVMSSGGSNDSTASAAHSSVTASAALNASLAAG